ncbi:MAG: mechanosensitive ion channel domain-containing protein [Betaproteobacteria bacterium]
MIAPVDWSQLETAMATSRGWTQLGIVTICIGIAWLVDRHVWRKRADRHPTYRFAGSFARVVFPLTAFVLLAISRAAMYRTGATLILDIALPLMLALMAIRMVVHALRRLFRNAAALKASERTVTFVIWGVVILHLLGVLPEIFNELDSIDVPIGKSGVSLLTLFKGALLIVVTLIVTLWISGFLEQRVMNARFDINLRVVLVKVMRAVLLTVGVLIALESVGFDMTLLTVFGGALGVGIGLGLQKLASNYVSGFAILFDRSIRMGDSVSVSGRSGIVTQLTARYVVVRDIDNVESIVPNEMMVTNVVLRHPPGGEARIALPVQVAAQTDVDRALALMEQAATHDTRVRTGANPPRALVVGFGDYGIRLELGVWVQNADVIRTDGDRVRSAVNQAMLAAFRENGIELARPPAGTETSPPAP